MTSNDPDEITDVEVVSVEENPSDGPVRNLPAVVETHEQSEPIVTKWSEAWWAMQPLHIQNRRCRAHSTRTGERCKNLALQGGTTVCRFHGGAAPQVKAKAKVRLEMAADLVAKNLLGLALTAESETVQLGATNSALDRVGITKPTEVVLSQGEPAAPWEEVFDGISTATRAESRKARGIDDAGIQEPLGSHAPPASAYADYGPTDVSPEGVCDGGGVPDARPPGPAHQVHHVTGEAALEVAAQLAQTRGLPSPHKRYPAP